MAAARAQASAADEKFDSAQLEAFRARKVAGDDVRVVVLGASGNEAAAFTGEYVPQVIEFLKGHADFDVGALSRGKLEEMRARERSGEAIQLLRDGANVSENDVLVVTKKAR